MAEANSNSVVLFAEYWTAIERQAFLTCGLAESLKSVVWCGGSLSALDVAGIVEALQVHAGGA
jgi:hypothetical protein